MLFENEAAENPYKNKSSFTPQSHSSIGKNLHFRTDSQSNNQFSPTLSSSILPPNFPLSPEQRQIYYKIYYLKHSFDSLKLEPGFRISQIAQKLSTDATFVEVLKNKCGKLRDNLKNQAEILQFLIYSHDKIAKKLKYSLEQLFIQREKLYILSDSIIHRRDFESKLNFEILYYRRRIEDYRDTLQETEGYLMVFAIIDKENKEMRAKYFEFAAIKSLVLKKYDIFLGEVTKLDLAFQEFWQYYSLDKESDSFLLKIQVLISVLSDDTQFADKGFEEVVRLTRMVTACLRNLANTNQRLLAEYEQFLENVEMSYINVEKIIYFRIEKISFFCEGFVNKQEEFFTGIAKFSDHLENVRINYHEYKVKQQEFRGFRTKLKGLKKEIKILRDDNKNLLFIKIRLIQSKKAIKVMKLLINQVNSGLFLAGYLENCLERELLFGVFLIKESEKGGISKLEVRGLQGRIRLFQERLKEILKVPALKPINHIPRKLLDLLDIAYERLENGEKLQDLIENQEKAPINIDDFKEKSKEEDNLEKKLKNFERLYASFLAKPYKFRKKCLNLQKEARNLHKEISQNDNIKDTLMKKDSLLGISNDLFFYLENLKAKWLEDRDFEAKKHEEEGIVKKEIEKIEIFLDKKQETQSFLYFADEIKTFIEEFQQKKGEKVKNGEAIREFLIKKLELCRENEFLIEIIEELLKKEENSKSLKEENSKSLKEENLKPKKEENLKTKKKKEENLMTKKEENFKKKEDNSSEIEKKHRVFHENNNKSPELKSNDEKLKLNVGKDVKKLRSNGDEDDELEFNDAGRDVEEIFKKSQEFKHKPNKKGKTPNLRGNSGDNSEMIAGEKESDSEELSIFNEIVLNLPENKNKGRVGQIQNETQKKEGVMMSPNKTNQEKTKDKSPLFKDEKTNQEKTKNKFTPLLDEKTNQEKKTKNKSPLLLDEKTHKEKTRDKSLLFLNQDQEKNEEIIDKQKKNSESFSKNDEKLMGNRKNFEGDSNDSDYIYGWDTYYISNALNNFFGFKEPLEIPMSSPKNNKQSKP